MGLKEYEVIQFIGKGTYGTVHKARRIADGLVCVIKKINLEGMKDEEQKEALNEVLVLCRIQHFNVVKLLDSFIDGKELILVMEYAAGGDLWQRLQHRQEFFDEEELWAYLIQISQGLKCLHDSRIIHRDIKPQNIFLDADDNIKIGDLGLGRILGPMTQATQRIVGTPLYFSPELCEGRPYNQKTDIWALGCLMFELASLRPPFTAANQVALARKIVADSVPSLPKKYSMELQFLIHRMLEKDANKRPGIDQILNFSAIRLRIERARLRQMEARLQTQYQSMEQQLLQQKKKFESELIEEKKVLSEQKKLLVSEQQRIVDEKSRSLEAVKASLKGDLEKVQDAYNKERQDNDMLRSKLKSLEDMNSRLKSQLTEVESARTDAVVNIQLLQRRCQEYESIIIRQNEDLAKVDDRLTPLREQAEKAENLLYGMNEKCSHLELRIQELEQEKDTRSSKDVKVDAEAQTEALNGLHFELLSLDDTNHATQDLAFSATNVPLGDRDDFRDATCAGEDDLSMAQDRLAPDQTPAASLQQEEPRLSPESVEEYPVCEQQTPKKTTALFELRKALMSPQNDDFEFRDLGDRSYLSASPDPKERHAAMLVETEQFKQEPTTPPRSVTPPRTRESPSRISPPRFSPRPGSAGQTRYPTLPSFSAEHFGLASPSSDQPIQFAAYFAWRRMIASSNSSLSGISSGRVQTGKVWDNRGKISLITSVRSFVCIFKINNSLPHRPEINAFRVRYQYEADFQKFKTTTHIPPPEKFEEQISIYPTFYFFVVPPLENKTINDIIVEFDMSNPIDEICILRPDKRLLDCFKEIPPLLQEDGTVVVCPILNDASTITNPVTWTPKTRSQTPLNRKSPKLLLKGNWIGPAQRVLPQTLDLEDESHNEDYEPQRRLSDSYRTGTNMVDSETKNERREQSGDEFRRPRHDESLFEVLSGHSSGRRASLVDS
eukprot:TRINITY_DN7283_c0_g1_i3.p1 TRINITY_DN7283_c0_g1~~TRINITY_DN7283_c0_g1_i3.p1  ORF type:complete len:950 (-),score=201.46 TRINITY_DN7283_c0_g1_i3:308-3157(-)